MNIFLKRARCAACLVLALIALATQAQQAAAPQQAQPDAVERQRVIAEIIAKLKEHYVDHAGARKIGEALRAHQKAGDYEAVTGGPAFARLLTGQIREVSHDLHLEVVYSHHVLPDFSALPPPSPSASYRRALEESNCTFETVKILPHNIGYLKLNSFPEPSVCEITERKAMASLNDADAIIFDLRDNHGGFPAMVMLLAAYLFDHPEYMYNPRENTTAQLWTKSPVPGNKLADKPAYVLTSSRTFSGAEHFSYNLKMLKRATLVGEMTGGATDVGDFYRLDDHFGMGIRDTNAINPFPEPDWAVNGIKPNVVVKAEDALETAEKLAAEKLPGK
ncbi:MAG TPA: S41 family peptidase [Terriglobia bacterium]|nr:S41 family peptidase [Terriglobia bacterium]